MNSMRFNRPNSFSRNRSDQGLVVRNLCVRQRRHMVLNHVSFEAEPGQLVVLLGRSGAGKSTVLRTIAGLQRHHHGEIYYANQRIDSLAPYARPVAMMLGDPSLFGHLTVAQNVAFTASGRDRFAMEQVESALISLGIDHLASLYPHQLSTGQQQSVALARCLVRRPHIMLFDEPLAHVDTYNSTRLKNEVLQTHKRMKCVTLYVTHDIQEAFSIADQILYLDNGRLIQTDSPQDMRACPRTLGIAQHLQASVFLRADGKVEDGDFGRVLFSTRVLGQDMCVEGPPELKESSASDGSDHTSDMKAAVLVAYPRGAKATMTGRKSTSIVENLGQVIRNTFLGDIHELCIETERGVIRIHTDADSELACASEGDEVEVSLQPDLMWALPVS